MSYEPGAATAEELPVPKGEGDATDAEAPDSDADEAAQ